MKKKPTASIIMTRIKGYMDVLKKNGDKGSPSFILRQILAPVDFTTIVKRRRIERPKTWIQEKYWHSCCRSRSVYRHKVKCKNV